MEPPEKGYIQARNGHSELVAAFGGQFQVEYLDTTRRVCELSFFHHDFYGQKFFIPHAIPNILCNIRRLHVEAELYCTSRILRDALDPPCSGLCMDLATFLDRVRKLTLLFVGPQVSVTVTLDLDRTSKSPSTMDLVAEIGTLADRAWLKELVIRKRWYEMASDCITEPLATFQYCKEAGQLVKVQYGAL